MSEQRLAGNGAGLIRERAMAAAVQSALERLYQLDPVADVRAYIQPVTAGRESLLVREAEDGALELALHIPQLAARDLDLESGDLDPLCQLIEGVSHFVYITHRATQQREATALELELQAEVDKWIVLGASLSPLDVARSRRLRARLYERVSFVHDDESELGERYRVANLAAARFVRTLEQRYLATQRFVELRQALRVFFRNGQEDKIRLGRAA
jgi:hypothetical protein